MIFRSSKENQNFQFVSDLQLLSRVASLIRHFSFEALFVSEREANSGWLEISTETGHVSICQQWHTFWREWWICRLLHPRLSQPRDASSP